MKLDMTPYGQMMLVEKLRTDAASKGGIILPEVARQNLPCAEIVKLGPDTPEFFEVGMLVFFMKFAGAEVVVDDVTHTFLDPKDILATAPAMTIEQRREAAAEAEAKVAEAEAEYQKAVAAQRDDSLIIGADGNPLEAGDAIYRGDSSESEEAEDSEGDAGEAEPGAEGGDPEAEGDGGEGGDDGGPDGEASQHAHGP